MAADDSLGLQFQYRPPEMGSNYHFLRAVSSGGSWVGDMNWNSRHVHGVQVVPEHRRKGVATSLWNEGQRLASENAKIPAPKHSTDRTDDGDAWARSVGGRLPRRNRA